MENLPSTHPIVFFFLLSFAIGLPAAAHAPSGHHEVAAGAHEHDEETMKAQHERMGNFRNAMIALGEAVIHGNKIEAQEQAKRLKESLRGTKRTSPTRTLLG